MHSYEFRLSLSIINAITKFLYHKFLLTRTSRFIIVNEELRVCWKSNLINNVKVNCIVKIGTCAVYARLF